MNVRFIAPDPRQRAKPVLDAVLNHGTEQVAIACAFLTPGGVEFLRPHAGRLMQPNSFVVVAWEEPTSLDALGELHTLIPGKLYVHLGAKTPSELGVGRGLMHSKVFFAKGDRQCKLWTGSHNLTASALQGANREAAVIVEGEDHEPIFADALAHLQQCRAESILFNPLDPLPPLQPEQTLVIHAECHATVQAPPWHVHLRPDNTDYDKTMRPPAAVWLYLYPPGTLHHGAPRPPASDVFSGTLTALNFTERHPQHRGISADWQRANYVVEFTNGIPHLSAASPHGSTPSQGVFLVEAREGAETVWLSQSPTPKLERIVGEQRFSPVDPEFRRFFTKQSLLGGQLLHQEYREVRRVTRVSRKEAGFLEADDLEKRLRTARTDRIVIEENPAEDERFMFIYRAKYRVRPEEVEPTRYF